MAPACSFTPHDAPYSVSKFGVIGLAESLAGYLNGTGVSVSVVVPGAIGGETRVGWNTMRVAGADRMAREDLEMIWSEQRAMRLHWPTADSMAATIVDGLQRGRFYIFQEGTGEHEDWALNEMREKWQDPDAFVLGQT